MPRVSFTQNLQRHVPCPPTEVGGATVAQALEQVFAANPAARSYVLDEQGAVRPHMAIFVNGRQIRDRAGLTDPVSPESEVYVAQALSGG